MFVPNLSLRKIYYIIFLIVQIQKFVKCQNSSSTETVLITNTNSTSFNTAAKSNNESHENSTSLQFPQIPITLREVLSIPQNQNSDSGESTWKAFEAFDTERSRGRQKGPQTYPTSDRRESLPERILGRIISFGSRIISRSLELVTGQGIKNGNSKSERDFGTAVGAVKDFSQENQSLHDMVKGVNPITIIIDRFMAKQNKLQRWREVKDAYRKKELERRVNFFRDSSGDIMTRHVRNSLKRLINKYEKNTDTMLLLAEYRKQRMQRFLEIPIISSILGNKKDVVDDNNKTLETTNTYQDNEDEEAVAREIQNNNSRRLNPITVISRQLIRFIENFVN